MANTLSRRHILAGLAGTVATPAIAQSVDGAGTVEIEAEVSRTIRRNTSTFRTADWREGVKLVWSAVQNTRRI